jgi:hypothetical protein
MRPEEMTPEQLAEYRRRMSLPPIDVRDLPVPIEGTGEERVLPDVEVKFGQPRVISRTSAEPIEDPELQALVGNLGGVADRAQAKMDGTPPPSGGGGMRADLVQMVMGAAKGRKPLQPQAGTPAEPSSYTKAGPSEEDKLAKALEFAKKRQNLGNVGAALTEQFAIANGRNPGAMVDRMRADAAAPVDEAQSKLEQAKRFVLERQKANRQYAQDATANERADRDFSFKQAEAEAGRRQKSEEFSGRQKFEAEQSRLDRESREREGARNRAVDRERLSVGKEGAALEKDVGELTKRLEGLPAMKNDLGILVKAAEQDDIPGIGLIDSRTPDALSSNDAISVRQAAKGVLRVLIKEQSGSAASDKEVDAKMEELGMGKGATEDSFRQGLQRLIGNVRDSARSKEAGVRPAAVDEARRRGAVTSGDLPSYSAGQKAAPAGKPKAATADDLNALFGKR